MAKQVRRKIISKTNLPDRRKIKAKNTTVDGIQFKSQLEAYTYTKLREAKLTFEYEEHKFILLSPGVYPGVCMELKGRSKTFVNSPTYSKISYTPDFVSVEEGWVIECKGHPNERFPIIWKLFKNVMAGVIHTKTNKAYDLYVPRNSAQVLEVINIIKQRKNEYNEKSSSVQS